MKKILSIITLLILTNVLHAADYYFSNIGNDANTGLSDIQAFRTIAKFNSMPHNVGDRFFFRRGDTFYGATMKPKTSGVTIGAYGSGNKPIISGLSTVTGWVSIGTNLWEAPVTNVKPRVKLVLRDNVIQQIGRYPNLGTANGGYLVLSSPTTTSISGPALSTVTNWTNAEVVIKHDRWNTITHKVFSHVGGVLTFNNIDNDDPRSGYGYFFQRDPRTLDQQGEWYYDSTTSKLRVFSTVNPSGYTYKINTVDTLIYNVHGNFTVTNLAFEGSGRYAIRSYGNPGFTVTNCDFNNSGDEAVTGWFTSNTLISNCNITNSLGSGIYLYHTGNNNGLTVTNCTVRNTSLFLGLESEFIYNGGSGIQVTGANAAGSGSTIVTYNKVYSSGYAGIGWAGNNASIRYNLVDSFGLTRDDVAGIYTSHYSDWTNNVQRNKTVASNFVMNGFTSNGGTDDPNGRTTNGLYVDDGTRNTVLDSNHVANIPNGATHGNDNDSIYIRHNTFFNTYKGITWQRLRAATHLVRGLRVTNNIIYPYRFEYRNIHIDIPTLITYDADVAAMGVIDSNYYIKHPGVDTSFFGISRWSNGSNYTDKNNNFAYIQARGHETHSTLVASGGTFHPNPSASPIVVNFPGLSKITPKGVVYYNAASVPAWSSLVLIPNGIAPTNKRYVSPNGNDSNNGFTELTPWATIAKANSMSAGLAANDSILFERGYTYVGRIIPGRNNLIYDAYGTGAKPIISGYSNLTSWTDNGGGVWYANTANSQKYLVNVEIDSKMRGMGRYPNAGSANFGYLNYETHSTSGTPTITDNQLTTTPYNWTGAQAVIKKWHWVIDTCRITNHVGGTLSYTQPNDSIYGGILGNHYGNNGYGYFIQDDIRTLDQNNEWFLNKTTKNLYVYFADNNPNAHTVRVSTIDTLFDCGGRRSMPARTNITIRNIRFEGANKLAVHSWDGANITVQNCEFKNNNAGTFIWNCPNQLVDSNTFTDCLSNPITAFGLPTGPTTVTNNTILRAGLILGLGESGDGANTAIDCNNYNDASHDNTYATVQYNRIDSVAYHGIAFQGANILIKNNLVNHYCMSQDDGGGIYTYADKTSSNRLIEGNIVLNGVGAPMGTSFINDEDTRAIYLDGGTRSVTVIGNSLSVSDGPAYYGNMIQNVRFSNNTLYNFRNAISFQHFPNDADLCRSDTITNNIVYGTVNNFFYWNGSLNNPPIADIQTDMRAIFNGNNGLNNNLYNANAIDKFNWWYHSASPGGTFYDSKYLYNFTLPTWKTFINADAASTEVSYIGSEFQYNASNSAITYNFPGLSKKTPDGTIYNNSISIPAWGSRVLIPVGVSNILPTANAGVDQVLTLPINNTTLTSLSTDPDGTITNYLWTKISGPIGTNYGTNTNPSLSVSNLVPGIYLFELLVTDNSGGTDRDTVRITQNGLPNVAPTANAGVDKTITLPTSSVTITGTGTDTDGTIASYTWVKISGPAGGTVTTPSLAVITVGSLQQGIYRYELTVMDNNGAIDKDTMQVTVNPGPLNIVPTANAGSNIVIQLPISSATLSGSGIDLDGVITDYVWVKVSGPAGGIPSSPTSASTLVTSLQQGVYNFQLTVTDDSLAIDRDSVLVTVLAANVLPIVNAGLDQVITQPLNTTSLTAVASDADGSIVSYSWVKLSGPVGVNFVTNTSPTLNVTNLITGVYQFQITVTDNSGAIARDTVQITSNPIPNVNPVAIAGTDQTITLPTSSTTLVGAGTDSDGSIANYTWTKLTGPAGGTISMISTSNAVVGALQQGVYTFQLMVMDNNGGTGRDTIQVTVNPGPLNITPIANAGVAITIQLPTSSANLLGSGIDIDGVITNYSWIKLVGPVGGIISSPSSPTTLVTSLQEGIYIFELTVTDDSLSTDTDTVRITVLAANVLPYTFAGVDQSITLPTNSSLLVGTASDADGTISSVLWTKISGPAGVNYVTNTTLSIPVNNLIEGVYLFELRVTDNSGGISRDTLQLIVNPPPNILPVVNAGPNQTITLPVNIITMAGSATDADGTIVSYQWTKVGGPVTFNITNAFSPTTTVTNLIQGVYQFQLIATDNNGAQSARTMSVTVNPAPIVPVPVSSVIIYNYIVK